MTEATPKVSASKNRETEKRQLALEQIGRNQSEQHYLDSFKGEDVDTVRIHAVSTYSTKFMSTDDQFTLAVDKVAFPELKSALLPRTPDLSRYESESAEIFDYASTFSMNDGDKAALGHLLQSMRDGSVHQYIMEDGPKVVTYMSEGSSAKVQFDFDFYNGSSFSGEEGVPSISASFVLSSVKDPNEYTPKLTWNYVLTLHCKEDKPPKDNVIKAEYEVFQNAMRAVLVSLGILPSKLIVE